MKAILDLVSSGLGKQVIDSIAKESGSSKEDTQSVVSAALPALLGALQNNASSGGAGGILQALSSKHDGSILDNLGSALGSGAAQDGAGILKHVLGDKQNSLQQGLSKQTGVSSANVGKILALLAPIVMGYLGRETKKSSKKDEQGLTDILGGLIGGGSGADLLGSLLGAATGKSKSSGGLGGLLGGLGSLLGGKK